MNEYIKDKRPSLSQSSIITYSSILRNLYKKVYGEEEIDFEKFNNDEKILDFLKDIPCNKRKTILSALVIITDNDAYRKQMLEDVKDYNHEISKQEKTPTQEANWITQEELKQVYDSFKNNANLIYKKEHKTNADLQIIQNFIIIALFTLIAPRRSKDYVDFRIKSVDKEKHNFIDKNKFVFNSYKTAKTYGRQEVTIPKELTTIINKWIKVNPTEYLLFDINLNPLTSVKLNQRLNRIFDGKKIAVNAIRHSYLTDKYADAMKVNKKLEVDMKEMGSSMDMVQNYIKIN